MKSSEIKIGKILGSLALAVSISLAFWYFLLAGLPDPAVCGPGSPAMTKEEALDLMRYHGVRVVYAQNGQWVFCRDGATIPLKRRPRQSK